MILTKPHSKLLLIKYCSFLALVALRSNSFTTLVSVFGLQLFGLIEKETNLPFLMQILSNIPWKGNKTTEEDSKDDCPYAESIKWICAKYAARYFMTEEQIDKLFELLCELQHWNDENGKLGHQYF